MDDLSNPKDIHASIHNLSNPKDIHASIHKETSSVKSEIKSPRRHRLPWGAYILQHIPLFTRFPNFSYKAWVWILTFLLYVNFHMTRKVFSAVKSELAPGCASHYACDDINSSNNSNNSYEFDSEFNQNTSDSDACSVDTWTGWPPFDKEDHCRTLLGGVDYAWLFAYAIFSFFSGMIADRMDLRYYLTICMIGNGIATCLVGMAEYARIQSIYYFVFVQLLNGSLQSTGWPGAVSVMGNWYGKARRGLIFGMWNSSISVGNILGTVIPAALLGVEISSGSYCYRWGLTFFVPGGIIMLMGVVMFLFLVVDPTDIGLPPPTHHTEDSKGSPTTNGRPTLSFTNPLQSSPDRPDPIPLSTINGDSKDANVNDDETHSINTNTDDDHSHEKTGKHKSVLPDYIVNSRLYRIVIGGGGDGAIGFVGALRIPGVIEYSLCFFFIKLVTYTFLFWLPFYIKNNPIDGECLSIELSDYISTVFDFGGILGGILAGWFSDVIDGRAVTCVTFLYISVPVLYLYRVLGDISVPVTIIMLLVVGFFVNAPYALIGTAVTTDLGTHKSLRNNQKAKATVSAIINGIGSIGAAFGPLLVGWVSDTFGWDSVFYLLMASSLLAGMLLTRLFLNESCKFIKKYIYSDIDKMVCGRYFFRN